MDCFKNVLEREQELYDTIRDVQAQLQALDVQYDFETDLFNLSETVNDKEALELKVKLKKYYVKQFFIQLSLSSLNSPLRCINSVSIKEEKMEVLKNCFPTFQEFADQCSKIDSNNVLELMLYTFSIIPSYFNFFLSNENEKNFLLFLAQIEKIDFKLFFIYSSIIYYHPLFMNFCYYLFQKSFDPFLHIKKSSKKEEEIENNPDNIGDVVMSGIEKENEEIEIEIENNVISLNDSKSNQKIPEIKKENICIKKSHSNEGVGKNFDAVKKIEQNFPKFKNLSPSLVTKVIQMIPLSKRIEHITNFFFDYLIMFPQRFFVIPEYRCLPNGEIEKIKGLLPKFVETFAKNDEFALDIHFRDNADFLFSSLDLKYLYKNKNNNPQSLNQEHMNNESANIKRIKKKKSKKNIYSFLKINKKLFDYKKNEINNDAEEGGNYIKIGLPPYFTNLRKLLQNSELLPKGKKLALSNLSNIDLNKNNLNINALNSSYSYFPGENSFNTSPSVSPTSPSSFSPKYSIFGSLSTSISNTSTNLEQVLFEYLVQRGELKSFVKRMKWFETLENKIKNLSPNDIKSLLYSPMRNRISLKEIDHEKILFHNFQNFTKNVFQKTGIFFYLIKDFKDEYFSLKETKGNCISKTSGDIINDPYAFWSHFNELKNKNNHKIAQIQYNKLIENLRFKDFCKKHPELKQYDEILYDFVKVNGNSIKLREKENGGSSVLKKMNLEQYKLILENECSQIQYAFALNSVPFEKYEIIESSMEKIEALIMRDYPGFGGDDILPLAILIYSFSNPVKFVSNFVYIDTFYTNQIWGFNPGKTTFMKTKMLSFIRIAFPRITKMTNFLTFKTYQFSVLCFGEEISDNNNIYDLLNPCKFETSLSKSIDNLSQTIKAMNNQSRVRNFGYITRNRRSSAVSDFSNDPINVYINNLRNSNNYNSNEINDNINDNSSKTKQTTSRRSSEATANEINNDLDLISKLRGIKNEPLRVIHRSDELTVVEYLLYKINNKPNSTFDILAVSTNNVVYLKKVIQENKNVLKKVVFCNSKNRKAMIDANVASVSAMSKLENYFVCNSLFVLATSR